jgi:hypothetical protein
VNLGTLAIPSKSFVKEDQLYEVIVEVRKFTQAAYNYTRFNYPLLHAPKEMHK